MDQRREEIQLEGSAALANAMAAIADTEAKLRADLEARMREVRERGMSDTGALAAELRAELAEAERRLGTQMVNEVRAHAQALERKRDSLTDAIQGIAARLDAFDERLRRLDSEVSTTAETLNVMARHRQPPAAEQVDAPQRGVNLNEATFEDLRTIGLSSTQAARVLSHRDAGGGFDSVERLSQVPGFPRKLFERVRPLVTV